MNAQNWRSLGWILLILGVFALMLGAITVNDTSVRNHVSETYAAGAAGTYECTDVDAAVADLAAARTPDARGQDPADGAVYLRFGDDIVSVSPTGPTGCEIRLHDRSSYNNGAFIFLGPGFAPASPAGSSGGSSGSGAGGGSNVK